MSIVQQTIPHPSTMKKLIIPFLITAAFSIGNVQSQTLFTSVGGNIGTAGNWDNGLPSLTNVGTININANIDGGQNGWIVNHTGGTAGAGFNRSWGGGTIWNLQGGTVSFAQNWNSAAGGYTLNVSSGSFTSANLQLTNSSTLDVSGGTVNIASTASNTGSVIDISGGSLTSSGGISISSGTMSVTGGTVTAVGAFTTTSAAVTFGLGNGSVSAGSLSTNGSTQLNFLSGSGASLSITGFVQTNYETLWGSNILRFNGGNAGSFADHFQVSGSTLSVIPEPTTWALLAGGLTFVMTLRKRRSA